MSLCTVLLNFPFITYPSLIDLFGIKHQLIGEKEHVFYFTVILPTAALVSQVSSEGFYR
jgi:hypothetical protein